MNATPLPETPQGTAIPVACLKSRATQAVTLTSNAVVYASSIFSKTIKSMASAYIAAADDTKLTFTALKEGWTSEEISVQVAGAGGELAIAVSGNAITITPKADSTVAEVAAAINANVFASALVLASYDASVADKVVAATQAKQYLDGWDAGNVGIYVLIQFTEDGFYGTFSEAQTSPMTASIPIPANTERWEFVLPGQKISLKSPTNGAKAYLTPAKQM
jgi:hypothetical protein